LTYRWVNEVNMELDPSDTSDRRSRTHLKHRLCMLAATCLSTFDICPEHIPATLVSEEDFSIAMQCAVIVHDNTPKSPSGDDSLYLTRMLSRHRRLLHHLDPILSESSPLVRGRARLLHADAYDNALARLWPGNHQGNSSNWHVLRKQNSRWISCVTRGGQEVHYDILAGELLVGGKSSGRLPRRIVEHVAYKSVFGAVSDQTYSQCSPAVSDLSYS
jgi:hypothetical protein